METQGWSTATCWLRLQAYYDQAQQRLLREATETARLAVTAQP